MALETEWGAGKERKRDRRSFRNVPLTFIHPAETLGWGALHVGMCEDSRLSRRRVGLTEREHPGPAASVVLQKWAGEAKPRQLGMRLWLQAILGRCPHHVPPSTFAINIPEADSLSPPVLVPRPLPPSPTFPLLSDWRCPLPFAPSHLLQAPSSATSSITNCFLESLFCSLLKIHRAFTGPLCSFLNLFSFFYKLSTFCAFLSLCTKKKVWIFFFFRQEGPLPLKPPSLSEKHTQGPASYWMGSFVWGISGTQPRAGGAVWVEGLWARSLP